jgi:hypothetical protein
MTDLAPQVREQFAQALQGRCRFLPSETGSVAEFIQVIRGVEELTWYRGQASIQWDLRPAALRYPTPEQCDRAAHLVVEFRRQAMTKIPNPPPREEEVEWLAIAQHYGLPTRLLDWTRNPVIALYFACWEEPDQHGAVYLLQPADLNRQASAEVGPIRGDVYDAQVSEDRRLLQRYGSGEVEHGCVALNPTYNSHRILLQKGAFTLHADRTPITHADAPTLTAIPVLAEDKDRLLDELAVIGIDEMSIFPELEHACNHLKRHV